MRWLLFYFSPFFYGYMKSFIYFCWKHKTNTSKANICRLSVKEIGIVKTVQKLWAMPLLILFISGVSIGLRINARRISFFFWWRERCWLIVRNMQVRCSEKVSLFFRLSDQNLRCLLWLNANVFIIVSFNRSCFGDKVCRELLSLKRKELAFVLGYYYSDYDLASLVHPLSKYTNGFQCFVIQNYKKVKTVEELAQLGGYTISTFRRIFNSVFHEPVYEWMLARRKEGILDDLLNTDHSISEICYKYGFESLPHFSNFCKKSFGTSPPALRTEKKVVQ